MFVSIFYVFSPFREIPDRIQLIVRLLLFEGLDFTTRQSDIQGFFTLIKGLFKVYGIS